MQEPSGTPAVGGGEPLVEGGPRPRPSLADALAAGGAVIVAIGALLVAIDLIDASGEPDWELGALVFALLGAAGYLLAWFGPTSTRPAAVTAVVVSVPSVYGFLFLPDATSFGDVRPFVLLTIATWVVAYVVPRTRARPVFVAASATLAWLWMVGEVSDLDAYGAAPVPSPPYTTPGEFYDAARGGASVPIVPAGDAAVGLDDLDPTDPLYPLAQDCADGDGAACDTLWRESPIGSDFEEFAATCGGREPTGPADQCEELLGGDDFGGDDFGTDDFGGDDFGTDDFGTDDFGTDDFGTDDFGTDDFGTDDFGTDDFGTNGLDVEVLGDQVPEDRVLEVGIVSLLFGAAYLATVLVLDARGRPRLATAFVVPAVAALVTAVSALGDASGSAIVGGLLTMAAGLAVGAVGWRGDRRFTTWLGGIGASLGALMIAGDVSGPDDETGADDTLVPGLVIAAFGTAVVALGHLVRGRLERGRVPRAAPSAGDGSPAPADPPGWSPPPDPPVAP